MALDPAQLDAFMRELTRHQARLRGFVRCLLYDRKDLEDVWQDTNVILLRKAEDFRPGSDFWAWACEVARYQVLTHCKKLGRDKLVFDDDLLALLARDLEQHAEISDRRNDALHACLAKLPAPQRQLLEMRYGPDASLESIATSLNRPVGSIRQTLFRIRESLLGCVERQLAAEGSA